MAPSFFIVGGFVLLFKHFFLFFTEVSFIYNIVLVSDLQQSSLDFICVYNIVKVAQSCLTLCDARDYIQSMEFSRPEYWSG